MAKTIDTLRSLGYEVETAMEGYDDIPDVLSVCGFGINLTVRSDDDETLTRLANPEAHASREAQEEGASPEDAVRADFDAKVALNDISQADADTECEKVIAAVSEPPAVNVDKNVLARLIDALPDGPVSKADLVSALETATAPQ